MFSQVFTHRLALLLLNPCVRVERLCNTAESAECRTWYLDVKMDKKYVFSDTLHNNLLQSCSSDATTFLFCANPDKIRLFVL